MLSQAWLVRADEILATADFDPAPALAFTQEVMEGTPVGKLHTAAGNALIALKFANRFQNARQLTIAKEHFTTLWRALKAEQPPLS